MSVVKAIVEMRCANNFMFNSTGNDLMIMPLFGRGFDATNYAVVAFCLIPQSPNNESSIMKAQIGRAKQTGRGVFLLRPIKLGQSYSWRILNTEGVRKFQPRVGL